MTLTPVGFREALRVAMMHPWFSGVAGKVLQAYPRAAGGTMERSAQAHGKHENKKALVSEEQELFLLCCAGAAPDEQSAAMLRMPALLPL